MKTKTHTSSIASVSVALILIIFPASILSSSSSSSKGFSIDLIHRDSPQSPFFNASQSQFDRLKDAFHRSTSRVKSYSQHRHSPHSSSEIIRGPGDYLMNFSLGTPPLATIAEADTGSELVWVQCSPCVSCYSQKEPLFNPQNSSTYKQVPCSSDSCKALDDGSCTNGNCGYTYTYSDNSFSTGDLATETLTLGGKPLPNTVIGCGHKNVGGGGAGIVGLGLGTLSLITQLSPKIQGKFSYCLGSNSNPSKLNFGEVAVVSGPGVVSTPLLPKDSYYVTLEGITVGDVKLSSGPKPEGNMMIDTGTTFTYLPTELYNQVVAEMGRQLKLNQTKDPTGELGVCFFDTGKERKIPGIVFNFQGADVKLQTFNFFLKPSKETSCLSFVDAGSDVPTFGNLAQENFLIGHDLVKKTVSFKAVDDCSKPKV